MRPTC